MPDLGNVGFIVPPPTALSTPRGWVNFSGATPVDFTSDWFERQNADGTPTVPSLWQRRRGVVRFPVLPLWPVAAGTRTLRLWCKHSGHTPYPRVVIRPNPAIGVTTQVEAVASASTDWQELVVEVTPTATGALDIWLEVRAVEQGAWAMWDDISAS